MIPSPVPNKPCTAVAPSATTTSGATSSICSRGTEDTRPSPLAPACDCSAAGTSRYWRRRPRRAKSPSPRSCDRATARPCRRTESPARLRPPRSLPHEHEARAPRAAREDRLRAPSGKSAPRAGLHRLGEDGETARSLGGLELGSGRRLRGLLGGERRLRGAATGVALAVNGASAGTAWLGELSPRGTAVAPVIPSIRDAPEGPP
jgi:hypothetical protein